MIKKFLILSLVINIVMLVLHLFQCFTKQLACKNKAFIRALQETHCTTTDMLVISNFSLAGPVLSRKHSLATFVHDQLDWSLVDQSPEQ